MPAGWGIHSLLGQKKVAVCLVAASSRCDHSKWPGAVVWGFFSSFSETKDSLGPFKKTKTRKLTRLDTICSLPSAGYQFPLPQPRTDGAHPLPGLPRDGTPRSCVQGKRNRGGAGGGCGGDARRAGPLSRSRGRGRVRLGPPALQKELLVPGERGRAGVRRGKMEAGGRER